MTTFHQEIIAGIIGGIVTALSIWVLREIIKWNKKRKFNKLLNLMEKAIIHRNLGLRLTNSGINEWIEEAQLIEEEAVKAAEKISKPAFYLLKWLDKITPHSSKKEYYISILSKLIERITTIVENNIENISIL